MEHTKLNRIHLHDLGYYLCLQQKGFVPPKQTRAGLLLAATLAAARSLTGRIDDKADIKEGLGVDLSPRGLSRLQALAAHLEADQGFLTEGIASYGPYDLVFIPTKIVPKPVLTVGLGDIISSSAFIIGTME